MNKNKQQSGFGALVILLLIIVLAGVAGSAWYLLKAQADEGYRLLDTSKKPTSNLDYEDDQIKFSYPKNWKVAKTDVANVDPGGHEIKVTAPADPNLKAASPQLKNIYLVGTINILPGKLDNTSCQTGADCKLIEFTSLSPKSPIVNGAGLALSDVSSNGSNESTSQLVVFTSKQYGNGESVAQSGLILNDKYIAKISAEYRGDEGEDSDVEMSVKLANPTDFQKSKQYDQFKQIASTIEFKTAKLK